MICSLKEEIDHWAMQIIIVCQRHICSGLIILSVTISGFVSASASEGEGNGDWCHDNSITTEQIAKILIGWRKKEQTATTICILKIGEMLPPDREFLLSFAFVERLSSYEPFFYSSDYFYWKRLLHANLLGYPNDAEEVERKLAYLIYLFEVIEPINRIPFRDGSNSFNHHSISAKAVTHARCFVDSDDAVSSVRGIKESEKFLDCILEK